MFLLLLSTYFYDQAKLISKTRNGTMIDKYLSIFPLLYFYVFRPVEILTFSL